MNKLTLTIIATTFATALHAQNGINSPYSRYGFGIQSERAWVVLPKDSATGSKSTLPTLLPIQLLTLLQLSST